MTEIINYSDIVEKNGKTIRENNLELKHTIPLGALVEIRGSEEWSSWHGCRLYVKEHGRDCDGTPLYSLGPRRDDPLDQHHGFNGDSLAVVQVPPFRED